MLKIIVILIILAIIIALIFAATKANTFRIERSINIKASPEKIFPFIIDFHHMKSWSAWGAIDPAMKRSFSGAASGKGAMYAWDGNKEIGQGSMEILESIPSSKVLLKLIFISRLRRTTRLSLLWCLMVKQPKPPMQCMALALLYLN